MSNSSLSKVFGWMFVGLIISFLTGYIVSLNENMVVNIFSGWTYLILVILELVIVIYLSARIAKLSPTAAKISFLLYSFVNGLTLASVFIVYEITSIIYVLLITAIVFGVFALIGKMTSIDLTKMGSYLMLGLIAALICLIVNMFLQNSTFDLFISIVIVLIFVGYTAYDVQRISRMIESGDLPLDNIAIYGALELYLDFINLFLRLLHLFGSDD